MKQPRLATSSKIKLLSLSHTPSVNPHPYYLIHLIPSTPPNPFLLPPPFIGILPFLSFPSFPTSILQSPTYIHNNPSNPSNPSNPINPTFERLFFPSRVFSFFLLGCFDSKTSYLFTFYLSFLFLFFLFFSFFLSSYLLIFSSFYLFISFYLLFLFLKIVLLVCLFVYLSRYFLPLTSFVTSYLLTSFVYSAFESIPKVGTKK